MAVAYIHKDGANFIGWTDVGGQYRAGDADVARRHARVPVFVLVNGTRPLAAFC